MCAIIKSSTSAITYKYINALYMWEKTVWSRLLLLIRKRMCAICGWVIFGKVNYVGEFWWDEWKKIVWIALTCSDVKNHNSPKGSFYIKTETFKVFQHLICSILLMYRWPACNQWWNIDEARSTAESLHFQTASGIFLPRKHPLSKVYKCAHLSATVYL